MVEEDFAIKFSNFAEGETESKYHSYRLAFDNFEMKSLWLIFRISGII